MIIYKNGNTVLDFACTLVGGPTALAGLVNASPQAVWNWRKRGYPPAEKCMLIEQATLGSVTCEQLRPDVFNQ